MLNLAATPHRESLFRRGTPARDAGGAMPLPSQALASPTATPRKPRIAIVHDFLYTLGGAESVLEQMLKVFPEAQMFSLFDFLPEHQRGLLQGKSVQTTFIQKLPGARKNHRRYLPLMPLAVEQLDVSQFDIILSSSYCAAKGVITRPDQLHICYCHSPVRFAWDLQRQYLADAGITAGLKSFAVRMLLHYIRLWDARTANGVDVFIANSRYIGRRILKAYRRKSQTIYPPVDVGRFELGVVRDDYYLTASRLVPYKRVDLLIEAFRKMPHRKLVVVGCGPEEQHLRGIAPRNVQILGYQPQDRLVALMGRARAFLYAAEEDFGIVAVEAQACGTPVLAFGSGGLTEIVLDGQTGLFFERQQPEDVVSCVERFEAHGPWDAALIRNNALRFSVGNFCDRLQSVVANSWATFSQEIKHRPQTDRSDTDQHAKVEQIKALAELTGPSAGLGVPLYIDHEALPRTVDSDVAAAT